MHWTKAARARLLPYPGDAWTVATNLKKADKAVAKAVGAVPDEPELEAEIARALAGRLGERYNEAGNHPRDSLPRDLVDVWCARRGVGFALEVMLGAVRATPAEDTRKARAYAVRWDGQPWGRLREHLFAGSADGLAAAEQLAAVARREPHGELRFGLDYAFCKADWIDEDLDEALDRGRGPLCVLAGIADPARIREVIGRMMDPSYRKFELVEEAVQHMPSVMSRLGDDGAALVIEAAGQAWNRTSRKPWLDLVACYDTPEALAFLAEFGPRK